MGKAFWIFVAFLFVGGYMIVQSNNLDINESGDQKTFIKKMTSWLVGVGKNTYKLVGHAVKMDWMPDKDKQEQIEINISNSTTVSYNI